MRKITDKSQLRDILQKPRLVILKHIKAIPNKQCQETITVKNSLRRQGSGIEPEPPEVEAEVLTTGPPGKSQCTTKPNVVAGWDPGQKLRKPE